MNYFKQYSVFIVLGSDKLAKYFTLPAMSKGTHPVFRVLFTWMKTPN